jgi:transposase
MTKNDEREFQRKLRVLRHAERTGQLAKTYSYFGIGRAGFYSWRRAYEHDGEARLVNAKTIPKNPPNQTPPELAEKVLQLRSKYHLEPERVMWYLARYHGIKLSDAAIYRILKRNGLKRLARGTRLRKVHAKRYNKDDPGHHIQVDV